jgi:glycosyltransferase involved in cell wall biosynthesis
VLETEVIEHMTGPVDLVTIDSPLQPYLTDAEYQEQIVRIAERREREAGRTILDINPDYGQDLVTEVARYALVGARVVTTDDFDIIHAHDWMTFLAGIEAKRKSGLPLVVHVHALEFDRSGESIDQRVYDIERYGMEQADRVIAVSQRTKDMIVARYGIDADKVDVVHNGISARSLAPLPHTKAMKEKLVVFLGRITMQKGPEYFLEAAYLVSRKLEDVRFVMAGSGDMLPRMIDRMAELRLLDRFHFTGFLNARRRDQLLAMADCFVMTSISEPFGLTPVEAIQHDVPVIVTKQCGVAEVLRSAIKADFWDVRRIADAIIKVLTEESLARQIVEGARHDLAWINWDRSARQIKHIYQEML